MPITQLMTAEELLALPRGRARYELVRGELREMSPAGYMHGNWAMRIAAHLFRHVEAEGLGMVFAAETGFKIASDPDTVRAPDVAFVRRERVEAVGENKGFWPGAPDLAVEVVSPGDTHSEVEEKVREWLKAGTRKVIVVSGEHALVTVYDSKDEILWLEEGDVLEGGDVVPGWRLSVSEIFA